MALHKKRIFKIVSVIVALFTVFFITLIYLGFLDWKKTLITKISSESTRFIGQDVAIEDLSLSLFKGLTLEDISIKNPKGFDSGNLLRVKKLYLKTRYRDLVGGTFHFDRIVVTAPEITLMKDKDGNLNISEKLRNFFGREAEIKYYIEEFNIDSGLFDFNNDKRLRVDSINLSITNLSSHPGKETLIKGWISYAEGNKIEIEGSANLKDKPKTFAISATSEGFNPDAFREVFKKYKVNTEKTKIDFSVRAEGDTEEHVQFTSQSHIAGARSDFLNKDIKDIQIDTNGMFNIREDSLNIESLSVRADHVANARLRATIKDIRKDPSYDVTLKINKIDLSAFNVVPDLQAGGIVTTDTMYVKGGLKKEEIRFSGGLHCTDCALKPGTGNMKKKNETRASSSGTQEVVQDTSDETAPHAEKLPYNISAGDIKSSFKGTISTAGYHGNGVVDAKGITVSKTDDRRNILKDTFLHSEFTFTGNDVTFKADARTGKIVVNISGAVKEFQKQDRSIAVQAHLPEIKATDIRDSLWDIFPDSLLYAGLDGAIASTISADYMNGELGVTGDVQLNNVFLEGENSEYAAGPINGTVPVAYSNSRHGEDTVAIPSFERSEYENLLQYYSRETPEGDYKRITIGSLIYGFKLLENITLLVRQQEGVLNIRHISATIFGGRLDGSALVDTSDGLRYRTGLLIKGLSLTKLCDGITPIRGYISGKVDGMAQIKGSGGGISQLIGMADFWTYTTEDEETTISKEFLQEVGGISLKTYLGDRAYDKGIMGLYIKDGFIIFKELEISNRNFVGVRDLSVKVVPLNNKISIDHLMWTIVEAAHRAKKK
jgi:hypothetical protein